MAGVSKAALTVFVGKKRPFESLKRVCSAFNCRRNAQWMFGTFYSENNWRGGRKKKRNDGSKKNKYSYECPRTGYYVPAIWQIDSWRILGMFFFRAFIMGPRLHKENLKNSIWEYTNGSCLRGPHRSNRWDASAFERSSNGLPRVFPCRPIYKLGDLYLPISQSSNFWFSCPPRSY